MVVTGTASDNDVVASVTWTNETTGTSGAATGTTAWTASVPLTSGDNRITVVATDGVGHSSSASITVVFNGPADAVPPALSISPPGATTGATPLSLTGTASDNVAVTRVEWENAATGGTGIAGGTTAWSAGIPLASGINILTVIARDAAGNSTSAVVTVSYVPPVGDSIAPFLQIVDPAGPTASSAAASMTLSGLAADDTELGTIVWVNGATGASGSALGLSSWSAVVPLVPGANVVTITAFDTAGNSTSQLVTVTFAAAAGGGGGGGGGGGCGSFALDLMWPLAILWISRKRVLRRPSFR